MDLCSKVTIKELLKNAGIHPSKKLGQNFLISRNVLVRIISTADLKNTDIILEIGPGIGTLTKGLAQEAKKVIAVEKDKRMIEILKETLKEFKNVEIINADILKFTLGPKTLYPKPYKIVANLPYYITSPVIRKFLEAENKPQQMILMLQKEVAQRIIARPPQMNLLAVTTQFYTKPEIISYVSRNCFWPRPKVDSAIIRIKDMRYPLDIAYPSELFFKIVRAGFSHPRKQLVNNLSNGLALSLPNGLQLKKPLVEKWLLENNIKPSQRAQTLSLDNWLKLAKTFKNSIMEK